MNVKINIEVWIAANILAAKQSTFTKKQLMDTIKEEFNDIRSGVSTHISSYCVASTKANPGKYRYLTRVNQGEYRIYNESDPTHVSKQNAPLHPDKRDIPEKYRYLLSVEKQEKVEITLSDALSSDFNYYDYQRESIVKIVDAVTKKKNILISIATGLGRNFIVSSALKNLFNTERINNALIIATRNSLLDQFSNILSENDLKNYRITPRLYTAHSNKSLQKSVFLSTIQYVKTHQISISYDLIIVDECHRLSDDDWQFITQSKAVIIGLSAVPTSLMRKEPFNALDIREPILSFGLEPIKLHEIAEVSSGVHYLSSNLLSKGKYKFIRPRDVQENEIINVESYVDDVFFKKNQNKALKAGDILLQNVFDFKRLAIVTLDDLPSLASNNFFVIKSEKINPKFLFNYLQSSSIRQQFYSQLEKISTGVTIRHIKIKDINEILIPIPISENQIDWFINLEKYNKEELLEINKQVIEIKNALKKYQKEGE